MNKAKKRQAAITRQAKKLLNRQSAQLMFRTAQRALRLPLERLNV